jgi:hypothetical protein
VWVDHMSNNENFESVASLFYDGYTVMKTMGGDVKGNAYNAIKAFYLGLEDNPDWKDNRREAIIQVLDCLGEISRTAMKVYVEAASKVLFEMEPPKKKKGFLSGLFG